MSYTRHMKGSEIGMPKNLEACHGKNNSIMSKGGKVEMNKHPICH